MVIQYFSVDWKNMIIHQINVSTQLKREAFVQNTSKHHTLHQSQHLSTFPSVLFPLYPHPVLSPIPPIVLCFLLRTSSQLLLPLSIVSLLCYLIPHTWERSLCIWPSALTILIRHDPLHIHPEDNVLF